VVLELVEGAALLLALCTLQSFNLRWNRLNPLLAKVTGGLLFGAICAIGMMSPLIVVPWAIFDPRTVVLLCAGLLGGPVVGVIAGTIAAAYRIYVGGPAVVVGCLVIVACVALGLVYRALHARGKAQTGPWQLLMFGFGVHIALAAATSVMVPPDTDLILELQVIAAIVLIYSPATLVLGLLLQDTQRRFEVEIALNVKEARLRAIASALPDLLFVMDEDGRYLEIVSGANTPMYGDVSALVGMQLQQVLVHADATMFLTQLRHTVRTGEMSASVIGKRARSEGCRAGTDPRRDRAKCRPPGVAGVRAAFSLGDARHCVHGRAGLSAKWRNHLLEQGLGAALRLHSPRGCGAQYA
jgi:PAS domain-containing protein